MTNDTWFMAVFPGILGLLSISHFLLGLWSASSTINTSRRSSVPLLPLLLTSVPNARFNYAFSLSYLFLGVAAYSFGQQNILRYEQRSFVFMAMCIAASIASLLLGLFWRFSVHLPKKR